MQGGGPKNAGGRCSPGVAEDLQVLLKSPIIQEKLSAAPKIPQKMLNAMIKDSKIRSTRSSLEISTTSPN